MTHYAGNIQCYACEQIIGHATGISHICMCFHEQAPNYRGFCRACLETQTMHTLRGALPTGHTIKSCLSADEENQLFEYHRARDQRDSIAIIFAVALALCAAYYMGASPFDVLFAK